MQSNFYNVVIFENLLFLENKSIENNKSVNSINFNVIKWLLPNCYIALVWKLIVCKYWYHHFNEWSLFVLEQDVREQIYDDYEYDIPITNTILFTRLFKTSLIRVPDEFQRYLSMYLLYYTMIYKITTSGNFTDVFVLHWTISWYNPCVLSWLVDQYRILIMWYVSTRRLMWSNSIKQNWNMRTKWICCTRCLVHFQ